MNQIRNYIEAMFSGLPKTREVVEMKLTMLENMEEKFEELLKEGKNENEAVGMVLADFGSMEELKAELGISDISEVVTIASSPIQENTSLKEEFYAFKKKFGIAIAIAVGFFILAPAMYLLFETIFGNNSPIAIFAFFLSIACGAGICIYFGTQNDKYKELLHIKENGREEDDAGISTLVASIGFPIATIAYLSMGFFWDLWHPGWIIFPITAMIVGISKSIFVYKKGNKH
ncbi:MAG: permease prefix domain 1-containing protein [Anaerovorax sp.]|nr:permease prefix domain 1-containing protein [Anaerovorax sp.]